MKPATIRHRWLAAPLGALVLVALAACNGSTVVTLTAAPSTDTFLTYRVGLVSIQVQNSNGRKTVQILPSNTTVDLAQLVDLSEVVGEATVTAGNFTEAVVTLDYSSAQIVYDDGSIDGVALTPLGASGQAVGQVTLTLYLDPSNGLSIARKSSARLSLEFNLAASNIVNLAQRTVTVTPLMAASASQIDTKTVRVQGPLSGVTQSTTSGSNTTGSFSSGIVPFDFGVSGSGSLGITPSTVTTFEINGVPSIGAGGLTQLAASSPGTMTVSFGTLTTSTSGGTTGGTSSTGGTLICVDGAALTTTNGVSICSDGSTPTTATATATSTTGTTSVSFAATQVLAGSSVQGSGFDRISGVVSGAQRRYAHDRGWDSAEQRRRQYLHSRHRHHHDRPQHGGDAVRRGQPSGQWDTADLRRILDQCVRHGRQLEHGQCHARCQRRPRAARAHHAPPGS